MQSSQKLEGRLLAIAVGVLLFFFVMVIVAVKKFNLDLPGCVTGVTFTKGEVLERAPLHYEIHYLAHMWAFEPENVELPTGSDVDIYLASADVTHGFQILGTNTNLMAVPGAVNFSHVKFTKPGRYEVVCHEYCGSGHQNMTTTIVVSDHPTRAGQAESSGPQALALNADAKAGSELIVSKGCTACHSIDPSRPGIGPTFKGLWNKDETLSDGKTVHVDAAYIKESIQQPLAKIVKGFQPVMPQLPVSNDEIHSITEYLKTLQ